MAALAGYDLVSNIDEPLTLNGINSATGDYLVALKSVAVGGCAGLKDCVIA